MEISFEEFFYFFEFVVKNAEKMEDKHGKRKNDKLFEEIDREGLGFITL